jgi:hypothetical protein
MQQYVNDYSRDIGTGDTPIVGSNAQRKLLVIVNNGGNTVYLRLHAPPQDLPASSNTGVRLAMGAALLLDQQGMFYGAISGITPAGSVNCTAVEVYEQ